MDIVAIKTPLQREILQQLEVGQRVRLSGRIYTARDAAHKRLCALLDDKKQLPFELNGSCIYYAGPSPAPPGKVIGACGPTTSSRVDAFTPRLLDLGLAAMIGKGERNGHVVDAMIRNGAVYFAATGGAGALLAKSVQRVEVIAFSELGCEAIHALDVVDMPLVVAIDAQGRSVYALPCL